MNDRIEIISTTLKSQPAKPRTEEEVLNQMLETSMKAFNITRKEARRRLRGDPTPLSLWQEACERFVTIPIPKNADPRKLTPMQIAKHKAITLTTCPIHVLITGPSGTGKEILARITHGPKDPMKFVAQNSASIHNELFDSIMFGHKKGAFTNALFDKRGLVERADGGTLFLDEIGDMPLVQQAKFLRLIEDGSYYKLGDENEFKVKIRWVCATNKDLEKMTLEDPPTFREDLYYRLKGTEIKTLPLKDHPEDLWLIAEKLAEELEHDSVPSEAQLLAELHKGSFDRGNVRQLIAYLNEEAYGLRDYYE